MGSPKEFRLTPTGYLAYTWRKLTKPTIVRVDGSWISVTKDLPKGIRKALYKGNYEYGERLLVQQLLVRGDRVLEIGSGIGLVALECARICGVNNLRCYEANPYLGEKIRRNFELNGWEAPLHNRAVTRSGGLVEFHFAENFISSSLIDRQIGEPRSVCSDALPDLLENFRPNAVVMDVEGAEVDLLSDADLSSVQKILVEMHPWIVGSERIAALSGSIEAQGLVRRPELEVADVACFLRETGI